MNFITEHYIYRVYWKCDLINESNSLKKLKKVIKQEIYINPIKECCYYQHYNTVKYLVSLFVDIDKELLLLAISTCSLRLVKLLIKNGGNIDEIKENEIYCLDYSESYRVRYKRKFRKIKKYVIDLQQKRENASIIIQKSFRNWSDNYDTRTLPVN